MKKIVSAILSPVLFGAAAGAYSFPQSDRDMLLSQRRSMVTAFMLKVRRTARLNTGQNLSRSRECITFSAARLIFNVYLII